MRPTALIRTFAPGKSGKGGLGSEGMTRFTRFGARALVVGVLLGGAVFLFGPGAANSTPTCTKTFTGAVSTAWGTAGNWSPSGAPGTTDDPFPDSQARVERHPQQPASAPPGPPASAHPTEEQPAASDDVAALSDAIACLIEDPCRRQRLSAGARARANTLPSWAHQAKLFAAVLDRI